MGHSQVDRLAAANVGDGREVHAFDAVRTVPCGGGQRASGQQLRELLVRRDLVGLGRSLQFEGDGHHVCAGAPTVADLQLGHAQFLGDAPPGNDHRSEHLDAVVVGVDDVHLSLIANHDVRRGVERPFRTPRTAPFTEETPLPIELLDTVAVVVYNEHVTERIDVQA